MNFFEKLSIKAHNTDKNRYERTYSEIIDRNESVKLGISGVPAIYRSPFVKYYEILSMNIMENTRVLELGCGTGIHSNILCDLSSNVTVLDVSASSLELCKINTKNKVKALLGSMDNIPCLDNSFDVVVSCGSLSYANMHKLEKEIERILIPGGHFIYLDSLNHNPIYFLNRVLHFVLRQRTLLTVLRIPTIRSLKEFGNKFSNSEIYYFDSFLWLRMLLIKLGLRNSSLIKRLETIHAFDCLAFRIVGINKYLIK